MKRVWQFFNNVVGSSEVFPTRGRARLMRSLGAAVGDRVQVRSGGRISTNMLTLGDRTFFNHGVFINNFAMVTIGDDVALGPDVLVTTVGHVIDDPQRRQGATTFEPVTIERGAWIGARATILPGVTVGEGCIVASGAVVNKDCEPHSLYAGVPARKVKDLSVLDDELVRD